MGPPLPDRSLQRTHSSHPSTTWFEGVRVGVDDDGQEPNPIKGWTAGQKRARELAMLFACHMTLLFEESVHPRSTNDTIYWLIQTSTSSCIH
mmetsp:Transcript_4753/g.12474  ORF Transcript_4753/g.12474 Transcript_4753/m.12474 type:complete len:92 (-) Transcript_4753:1117-1392(-)